jgi:hypothetical protein
MFQHRQALVRLRAGDSVWDIARSGLMGRDKLAALRARAEAHGCHTMKVALTEQAMSRQSVTFAVSDWHLALRRQAVA